MFEAAVSALMQLCTPYYFMLFMIGILLGLAIGLIPGMSGVVALSLILPFTVKLDAHAALPLVMGLVSPILTSDSIPAILIGTPGAACAATVVDGYPMAQKGEAGRALGIAFAASALGGVFGALLIAVSIPILKPLVLFLETPDFLALSVLALSAVAILSGGNMLKGIGAAGIGLLLSMIGQDPIRFVVRWNFGSEYLINSINIIPVALGLFAIPELLELCAKGITVSQVPIQSMKGRREGVIDTLKEWRLVLSSSALAAFIGFLPGLGSTVSTWLCYSWAVITTKDKSGFGKGDVRGVIAAEGSNNASAGGSLIPTIAFGVPGSHVTALVLVVFWAVGITPGPKLLTEHVDMVFLIVWSVALANIIGSVICYLLTNQLAKITTIPPHLLAPLVFSIIIASTLYSTEADIGGIILLIGFGILGWLTKALAWSRAALLMGFILGPLIEKFYFHTIMMYNYAWLLRPSVIIILLCAVGLIGMGMNLQKKATAVRGN
jgi:putative tricarboxylic transport membrane protein